MASIKKIAICHQSILEGDAIGHDIYGMAQVIIAQGWQPVLLAEYFGPQSGENVQFQCCSIMESDPKQFDLIIYHHSVEWALGETFLEKTKAKIVVKYHNITPPEFFKPYAKKYEEKCKLGRQQTTRLAQRFSDRLIWLSDSEYNQRDLQQVGILGDMRILAPMHKIDAGIVAASSQAKGADDTLNLLFVGRFAPNKGHFDLIKVIRAYVSEFSNKIKLSIVGSQDPALMKYLQEIVALIEVLKLGDHIALLSHVSQAKLMELYSTADAFLCMSKHEGFCVPLIEAQAIGLPIIANDTTAMAETLGVSQICLPEPKTYRDYVLYAYWIEQLGRNQKIKDAVKAVGKENFNNRFSLESIKTAFSQFLHSIL
jgi:glycosyltransferase involved in cell wall biosynthesis